MMIGPDSRHVPVPEVQVTGSYPLPLTSRAKGRGSIDSVPRDAFSLTIVTKAESFVQFDVSKIELSFDLQTYTKMSAFLRTSIVQPKCVLPPTARAEVLRYLLRQSSAYMSSLNCSIRFHGFSLVLPFQGNSDSVADMAVDSQQIFHDRPRATGVLLTGGMVEVYSGTAVDSLLGRGTSEFHHRSESGLSSMHSLSKRLSIADGSIPTRTRYLEMLDVPALIDSRGSVFSHHWVSVTNCIVPSFLYLLS